MNIGKKKCKILKEIRRQIAEANDIEYIVDECSYKGECSGTCPKCEADLRRLEEQIEERRRLGKAVAVASVSVSLAALPLASCKIFQPAGDVRPVSAPQVEQLRGKVAPIEEAEVAQPEEAEEPGISGTFVVEGAVTDGMNNALHQCTVEAKNEQAAFTDDEGHFKITVHELPATLHIYTIGYEANNVRVTKEMVDSGKALQVIMEESMMTGEVVISAKSKKKSLRRSR